MSYGKLSLSRMLPLSRGRERGSGGEGILRAIP
jgi:hypothetical protein